MVNQYVTYNNYFVVSSIIKFKAATIIFIVPSLAGRNFNNYLLHACQSVLSHSCLFSSVPNWSHQPTAMAEC